MVTSWALAQSTPPWAALVPDHSRETAASAEPSQLAHARVRDIEFRLVMLFGFGLGVRTSMAVRAITVGSRSLEGGSWAGLYLRFRRGSSEPGNGCFWGIVSGVRF